MRHIGNLPHADAARAFHDYLLAQGVPSNIEEEGDGEAEWSVWIINEDQVDDARDELARFQTDPSAPEYAVAAEKARHIRREQERREREIRKKTVDIRRKWERPLYLRIPVTMFLIAASVLTVLLTTDWNTPLDMGDKMQPVAIRLVISPYQVDRRAELVPALEPIADGQVWRLFTPMFLHFGPLHILFNMVWLRQLGAAIELRRGSLKFLWFVLLIAGISNLAQYFWKGPMFGGMSGVVFGLFGYIWMQSKFDPTSGFFMPPNLVFWMIAWFVICLTGAVGPIANMAHGMGLAVGAGLGYFGAMSRRMS